MTASAIPPVVKTVRVKRPQSEAFAAFTAAFGVWWPKATHSLGKDSVESIVLEPRAGGAIYERWTDGTAKPWGVIVEWSPPLRLAFTWHVGRAPEQASRVTVTFTQDGADSTRVDLVHSGWESFGAGARETRDDYDTGWVEVFERRFGGHAARADTVVIYASWNFPPMLHGVVRDLRALWAAEETGCAYTVHWVDVKAGEQREAGYSAINPFAKVPALTCGPLTLFESAAIVAYLGESFGGLVPPDTAGRARYWQWSCAAINTVEPPVFDVFLCDGFLAQAPGTPERRAAAFANARGRIAALDRALGASPFLLGERFSGADILMTTVLNYARDPALVADAPAVRAYLERMRARPAYVRALALQGRGPG